MFSVITNIYNKKTKGSTLMELFTAVGNLFFFVTTRDFRCVHNGCTAQIDRIFKFLPHTLTRVNLNIVSMCAVSPVVHTSKICSCQKKIIFPVAVKNSAKVDVQVHTLTRVNLNIVSMCIVSPVVHTSNISSCKKNHFSCGCEKFR